MLRGIETCFAGDYDQAWNIFDQVNEIDPNHPSREFYQATVLFWRNNVDHSNPRYDAQIKKLLLQCMEKSKKWLEEDEQNIDALHYIGLAYTYLGRIDAHRGKLYSGGVKGETGRKYLEKAIEYCRQKDSKSSGNTSGNSCNVCEDIYFPYGAYSYFSGRLPKLLRLFNFLWFIPQGSTEEGLNALSRALEKACLHQLGTRTLLVSIYSRFEEDRIQDAFAFSSQLIRRFPDNPYLDLEHARLLILIGQYGVASKHADRILSKVTRKQPNYDVVVALGAKLIIVESALKNQKIKQAKTQLQAIKKQPQYQNNTLTARIFLLQGQLADLEGLREEAISSYQKVVAFEGHLQNRAAKKKAKIYLDKPFVQTK
ncbi:MAG: hypothetical protein JRI91_08350 [Deltaproteobacteria bacterium]|nr:hypothetical protein [Deltaproteobacteria bacterium]